MAMKARAPNIAVQGLERFLQMCAELNLVITNITTASNFFHALKEATGMALQKAID